MANGNMLEQEPVSSEWLRENRVEIEDSTEFALAGVERLKELTFAPEMDGTALLKAVAEARMVLDDIEQILEGRRVPELTDEMIDKALRVQSFGQGR